MITISEPSDVVPNAPRSNRGVTAVELMFVVTILALVVTILLAAFLMFAKGAASVTDYSIMNMEGRRATETISRDFRSAHDVLKATEKAVLLEMPKYITENNVEYRFRANKEILLRTEFDSAGNAVLEEPVMTHIKDFSLHYFDNYGDPLTVGEKPFLEVIKSVQIKAQSSRNVSQIDLSSSVITPRFMLRNRTPFYKAAPRNKG